MLFHSTLTHAIALDKLVEFCHCPLGALPLERSSVDALLGMFMDHSLQLREESA